MKTLSVIYKCKCMKNEAIVELRERLPSEEMDSYMEHLQMFLSADHANRSPLCAADRMEYVKLPVPSEKGIGFTAGGDA